MSLMQKLFGTHSERELKRIMPLVEKIEGLRPTMQALTDDELKAKTQEYKKRLSEGKHWTICSPRHMLRCVRHPEES